MSGMDDYLRGSSYTDDSSEGGGQHMSLDDEGEGFYGRVTGNQDKKYGDHDASKAAKQKNAADGLKGGEKNALGGNGSKITGDGILGARQGEGNVASGTASDNATSGFKNGVTGSKGLTKGLSKGKGKGIKGKMKKMLPILLAAGGIGGFGMASFFGQLAMPFSLLAQLQGNFDSIGTSNFVRARTLTRIALHSTTRSFKNDHTHDFIEKHGKLYRIFTGNDESYFKISKKQVARFEKKGIRVMDGGPNGQYLEIDNADGEGVTKVVADKGLADSSGGEYRYIDDVYAEDENFRSAYFEGTKTWRQAIKAWFDNLCTKFLNRIGIKRNRFKSFNSKNNTKTTEEQFESMMKEDYDSDYKGEAEMNGAKTPTKEEKVDTDGDGNPDTTREVPDHGRGADSSSSTNAKLALQKGAPYQKIADDLNTFANAISSKYNKIQNVAKWTSKIYCFALEVVNAISLLIMAKEMMEVAQNASRIFEGIQKGEVEDSSKSPINNIANDLTTKKTTKYYQTQPSQDSTEPGTDEMYSSAMESEAITSLYGNLGIDTSDLSVKSFTLTEGQKHVIDLLGAEIDVSFLINVSTQMTAYTSCIGSKMIAGIVDAIGDIAQVVQWAASIIACIGGAVSAASGAGAAVAFKACGDLLKKIVMLVSVMIAMQELMKFIINVVMEHIVPAAATIIKRDLATNIGGSDFGNALVSGANIYMGKNHQGGGGMATTQGHYVTYLKQKEEYIADIARHERETRSPFDASSPYTFMGNLLSRSVPILVGNSTIFESIKNVASVTSKALTSLIPGASAVTAATTAQEAADNTATHCADLASIKAVGDAFCNPYYITDFELMEEDPADILTEVSERGNNFDLTQEGDIPVINTKVTNGDDTSKLMEYILYCGQRDSPLGMVNMNIGNAIASGNGSSWTDYLPIWGGIADFLKNAEIIHKIGYVTGGSCVIRDPDGDDLDDELGDKTFKWEDAKYYQRFVEDQRYMESAGLVDKSSVSIALDKYYEENPLDNSEEGILARLTGMPKEKVIATQEVLDVLMWIGNYNPDGYYPYVAEKPEEEKISVEDGDLIELDDYNLNDDHSWKYIIRMEYNIS